ncbi:MAG: ATP-dependent helicase HrpB [Deltaproteobacteria bacterium]|nr:MAG: ATP-dependent helicase HrpB [Deltaproteobacteria bacterium]
MSTPVSLPIDSLLPDVVASLRQQPNLVLQAPTGAGKTTRLPLALWRSGVTQGKTIVVLEPRRLAARTAAMRMAYECGEDVGETVGYWVRFDRKVGPNTRILVVTEGIFITQLQADPFLEDIAVVVFDEYHERSLSADLALAMTQRVQQEANPDLRIVVMSATLSPEPIAAYLSHCPTLVSKGRNAPVSIEYLEHPDRRNVDELAASGVRQMASRAEGDILVFLPGVGEIQKTMEALEPWASSHSCLLLPLHGAQTPADQDKALAPSQQRKVILATNVAETSLTIEGIRVVVDTGLARVLRYDPSTGLNRLVLERISQASATQRAGRAGRTAPGQCLRLWTETQHRKLPAEDEPEIGRVDLTNAMLELYHWGETEPETFPWYQPPPPHAVEQSLTLLQRLGALDDDRQLTALGKVMAQFPVHPRLAMLLLAGHIYECLEATAGLAAMMSERDAFRSPERSGPGPSEEESLDILDRWHAFRAWLQRDQPTLLSHRLKKSTARNLLRVKKQLLRTAESKIDNALLQKLRQAHRPKTLPTTHDAQIRCALLMAYPDRVAKRRQPNSPQARMVGGKGVVLARSKLPIEGDLLLCPVLSAGAPGQHADWLVRQATPVQEEWLPQHAVQEKVVLVFDEGAERVSAFRRRMYQDLILQEAVTEIPNPAEASRVLAEAAQTRLSRALDLTDRETHAFLTRLQCLAEWMPELESPRFDEEELVAILPMLCSGKRSFAELRATSLAHTLKGLLPYPVRQTLDDEIPERLQVPSGSHIRLQYEEGRPPILPVRIQEMFGLQETPRIAGGRVPVLLHLLAPNMRPQQVTQDLANFWRETYQDVRKELRQRYPKHAWPEDPTAASPERRPQRRRR